MRQDFQETLVAFEGSLSAGLDVGNYDLVQDTFVLLEGFVDRTRDGHWKAHLRKTILKSPVVKGAVDALYEFARENDEFAERAVRWQLWLDGLE